eukprot:354857-Chlamydomonas_euryale.AAC.45
MPTQVCTGREGKYERCNVETCAPMQMCALAWLAVARCRRYVRFRAGTFPHESSVEGVLLIVSAGQTRAQ